MGCCSSSEDALLDGPSAAQLVTFDPKRHGKDVVVANFNVSGSGAALSSASVSHLISPPSAR